MTDPKKNWIQSLTNKRVEPLSLKPEMVGPIEEIAHALAGKFRFTCQTKQRYSVAEHCVRGSRWIAPEYAGAFLLHELSEVYLPDIAAPLKPFVFVYVPEEKGTLDWAELERDHQRVILDALGLAHVAPAIYSPEVKAMDLAMLVTEKRDLLGPSPVPWGIDVEPLPFEIEPWSPRMAYAEFMNRYYELFGVPK